MVAQSPLHVLAVPIEQLLLSDPGGVVAALRQYIALQLTYWFSRCGMISKHVRPLPRTASVKAALFFPSFQASELLATDARPGVLRAPKLGRRLVPV